MALAIGLAGASPPTARPPRAGATRQQAAEAIGVTFLVHGSSRQL
jgi:hypothetical protein